MHRVTHPAGALGRAIHVSSTSAPSCPGLGTGSCRLGRLPWGRAAAQVGDLHGTGSARNRIQIPSGSGWELAVQDPDLTYPLDSPLLAVPCPLSLAREPGRCLVLRGCSLSIPWRELSRNCHSAREGQGTDCPPAASSSPHQFSVSLDAAERYRSLDGSAELATFNIAET